MEGELCTDRHADPSVFCKIVENCCIGFQFAKGVGT